MGTCDPETEGENETYINQQRQHQIYHKPVNTLVYYTFHPRTLERQDAERQEVWGHIRDNMRSGHVYIGETKRPLGKRFKEHTNLTIPTGVGDHCNATGHSVSLDNTKVLTREPQWTKRKVKEAIYIKKSAPSMNSEQWYQLPPIYHQLLLREQFPRKKTSRDQGF